MWTIKEKGVIIKLKWGEFMRIGAVTDIGKQRNLNEDSYFIYRNENLLGGMVADGMGGHRAGEIASGMATKTVKEYIIKTITDLEK